MLKREPGSSGLFLFNGVYNGMSAITEWSPHAIMMFRVFSGDLDAEPTWSDSRILQILVASAYSVISEMSICIEVPTFNLCTGEFSDDPFSYASFVNLWMYRAVCLVDQGVARTKALSEGLKAVCGPATLQVLEGSKSYQLLINEGACSAFNDLKEDLCFRNPIMSANYCKQIVGVFTSPNYNSEGYCDGGCSYYR